MKNKLIALAKLMRWDKPIGIYLCLWPSLWALWLASNGRPSIVMLSIIILGSIIVRSAGCVINDVWDRNFDLHVHRTRSRPITSGEISVREALLLFACLGVAAFGLVLQLNTLSVIIALATGFLTLLYPLAKRVTDFPQIVLGVTFNAGILIAFAATQSTIPTKAWALYATAIVWTVAYDTIYAMADQEDDKRIGVRSTALLFGEKGNRTVAYLQTIMLVGLIAIGLHEHYHHFFFFALFIAACMFLYQQKLMRFDLTHNYMKAFLNNHWVGFIILLAIVTQYW